MILTILFIILAIGSFFAIREIFSEPILESKKPEEPRITQTELQNAIDIIEEYDYEKSLDKNSLEYKLRQAFKTIDTSV